MLCLEDGLIQCGFSLLSLLYMANPLIWHGSDCTLMPTQRHCTMNIAVREVFNSTAPHKLPLNYEIF